MNTIPIRVAGSVVAGLGALTLAVACGASTSAGGTPQYGAPSGAAAAPGHAGATSTVSLRMVNGSPILIDSAGAALYTNDQDNGKPTCVSSSCTAVWRPLTVPAGQQPTTGSGITAPIATVAGAGGKQQVTLNGKPLYSFALDSQPGQVHGNGAGDTFDGKHFTWHSATPAGGSAPASSGTGTGTGGGGSYGY